MRWLTLLVSAPPTPTRHRVGVWRKLKRMGAVTLRGSAWILPETPETTERFQWLVQEVQTIGGGATLLRVDRIETMTEAQVTGLFHKAIAPEYEAVLRGCRELAVQLDRYRTAHRGSPGQLKAKLEALKRELDRLAAIDYLESPIGRRARETWEGLAKRLRAAEARLHPGTSRRRAALPPPGSVWVTRPRPHIDRIASAWLIKRFIDPQARFAFAEAEDAPRKGIPYDILGAEFGHHGDDCTFETLLKRCGLKDRRLRTMAEIVHEVDLADGKFTRPESRGIDLALHGVAAATQDDHELLERGITMFDGLYAVLKQKT
jgi:hypothetical protein